MTNVHPIPTLLNVLTQAYARSEMRRVDACVAYVFTPDAQTAASAVPQADQSGSQDNSSERTES